jgi:hypothetical protein
MNGLLLPIDGVTNQSNAEEIKISQKIIASDVIFFTHISAD